ncbi:MAG: hypothetical protein U9Q20_05720 [Campylobacterota bacterium]|nr:hypothetical protein [Campylobacterota bacterium]
MIKTLGSLALIGTFSFSMEFYAKLEPLNTYNIKSSVSGNITYVNKSIESKNILKDTVIKIDSIVNKIDLKQSVLKLKSLEDILAIENSTLESYKKISSKSKFDKDNQKIKILNIESSMSDLKTKIATLKDQIKKKTLIENDKYIYNIAVEIGDYVNPGTLLYTAMDLTKGKLEVYIPMDSAKNIKNKTIYIDGKKSNLKISKLYSVADSKHISSYKCEIIVTNPETFSKLTKIEFK